MTTETKHHGTQHHDATWPGTYWIENHGEQSVEELDKIVKKNGVEIVRLNWEIKTLSFYLYNISSYFLPLYRTYCNIEGDPVNISAFHTSELVSSERLCHLLFEISKIQLIHNTVIMKNMDHDKRSITLRRQLVELIDRKKGLVRALEVPSAQQKAKRWLRLQR